MESVLEKYLAMAKKYKKGDDEMWVWAEKMAREELERADRAEARELSKQKEDRQIEQKRLEVESKKADNEKLKISETAKNPQFCVNSAPPATLLRRPEIPLPYYSGQDSEILSKFLREFESAIEPYKYTENDKFQLLKDHLKGRALKTIECLDIDQRTFNEAKQHLCDTFGVPELQIDNSIKQFLSLKFDRNTDPYEYLAKIKTLRDSVKQLKITENEFMRHFIWNSLNLNFQKKLTLKLGKSHPNLEQIFNNFLEVSRMCDLDGPNNSYNVDEKEFKHNKKFASAIAVKPLTDRTESRSKHKFDEKNKPCVLCSNMLKKRANHSILDCKKFPTPRDKVDQLKKIKGCIKCGLSSHTIDQCKIRFNAHCSTCNKNYHKPYLCTFLFAKERPENKNHAENIRSSNSISIKSFSLNNSEESVVLPF